MRKTLLIMAAVAAMGFTAPAFANAGYQQLAYSDAYYSGYSYDMFPSHGFFASPHDEMYSTPNYVAPSAPPPPPPVTYIDDTSGQYCRQFSEKIHIDGHLQEAFGTACLQPDGSWRVVH